MRGWMRMLALGVGVAACGGDADEAERPAAPAPVPSAAPAPAPDSLPADTAAPVGVAAGEWSDGLTVVFERRGEADYVMYGRTQAPSLELSVEDGHNVLFGPTQVEVRGGAFRVDVAPEPTGQPASYAYITEPGGSRQWVLPIPRDSVRVGRGPGAAGMRAP